MLSKWAGKGGMSTAGADLPATGFVGGGGGGTNLAF